jgi:hypothetical protein
MENTYREKVIAAVLRLHEAGAAYQKAQAELDDLIFDVRPESPPESGGSEVAISNPKLRAVIDAIKPHGADVWTAADLIRRAKVKKPQQLSHQLSALLRAGAIERVGKKVWRAVPETLEKFSRRVTD